MTHRDQELSIEEKLGEDLTIAAKIVQVLLEGQDRATLESFSGPDTFKLMVETAKMVQTERLARG